MNLEKRQHSPQSFPTESSLRKHTLVGFRPYGAYLIQGIPQQQRSEDQMLLEAPYTDSRS
ncbi:hypothetical protein C1I60_12115 [Paenibacillus terrae]|uniref:Uncharacterized protein n=1 Tax=Paenibacillus terrae TaxID=159743 RepID=A0A4U2PX07_9BACL|nr:hypothetical protein [Paenibacillus terrae]TKH44087.1 hypothetical protein C1I60_12115 [Paenibacillus terrae]